MTQSCRRRRPRSLVLLAVCLGLIVYFSYHAVHGGHGLHSRAALTKRLHELEKELASLKAERAKLEHDVSLMTAKAGSDPDMLDEQARSLLNFAHPADIVIVRGAPEPK